MADVKMTSMDSGIDTGNDSNDSAQPENLQLQSVVGTNTIVRSTEALLKKKNYDRDQWKIELAIPSTTTSTSTLICSTGSQVSNVPAATLSFPASDEWAKKLEVSTRTPISNAKIFWTEQTDAAAYDFCRELLEETQTWQSLGNADSDPKKWVVKRTRRYASRWFNTKKYSYSPMIYEFPCDRRMRIGAATNNIALVRRMLENGVSPNNFDEQGRSPLHLASSRGYTDVVQLLLDYGANPNVTDSIGNTPLHLAAVTSKGSVVELLLKAGTDVNSSDRHGYNPLQLAQTKLRMLQNCKGSDMRKVKDEVHKIVGMILRYLQKKKDSCNEIDTLTSFCSRVSLSNTTDQVQDDLKDLLASIDSLSLK